MVCSDPSVIQKILDDRKANEIVYNDVENNEAGKAVTCRITRYLSEEETEGIVNLFKEEEYLLMQVEKENLPIPPLCPEKLQ
jgi:hypothetical protein